MPVEKKAIHDSIHSCSQFWSGQTNGRKICDVISPSSPSTPQLPPTYCFLFFSLPLSLSFHVSGLLQDRPSHQGGPSKRHSVCLLQQCRQPQRVHRQLSHPPGRLQLHGEALRGHQLRETHHVPHQFQLQWRRRTRARRFASSQPSWAGRSGECPGMRWR